MKAKTFFLCIITISILMSSCQKEEEPHFTINPSHTQSEMSDENFARYHLTNFGNAALHFSQDGNFRSLLYLEIAEQFDDDYNTLFKSINEEYGGTTINIATDLLSLIGDQEVLSELENSWNAFSSVELDNGEFENFYPQIFIPFYEELVTAGLLGQQDPIIIIYVGTDEEFNEFEGLILNSNGEIEIYSSLIDESFAMQNEIWVVSLNETVLSDGSLPVDMVHRPIVDFYMDNIKIKSHYEKWVAGASEVSILANLQYWDGLDPSGIATPAPSLRSPTHSGDRRGHLIKKIKRKDVKNHKNHNVNYLLEANWHRDDFFTDPIEYTYAIFEYDSWPTSIKENTFFLLNGTASQKLRYRSANRAYRENIFIANTNGNPNFLPWFALNYHWTSSDIDFDVYLSL